MNDKDRIYLNLFDSVRVKHCGNVIEVMYQDKINRTATIRKINKNQYELLATGEIFDYKKKTNTRVNNLTEVRRSLNRLRDYINTNCIIFENCKWLTFTYRENMKDTVRLTKDIKRVIRKVRTNYGNFEYIICREPQGRGAWHAHIIFIYPFKAPYVPQKFMYDYWGNGSVRVNKMVSNDNVGAYLTAYLGDIELNDTIGMKFDSNLHEIKKVNGKRYVKGARMYLYPKGFNLYTISKGIKKPYVERMKYSRLKEMVRGYSITFEKDIKVTFNGIDKKIRYEYYNLLKKDIDK